MTLDSIELHDALITKMDVDFSAKIVRVFLEAYKTKESRVRAPATLEFTDVESMSNICDLGRLSQRTSGGNVNYWVPGPREGTTYVYLVDGCFAIKAKTVRVTFA